MITYYFKNNNIAYKKDSGCIKKSDNRDIASIMSIQIKNLIGCLTYISSKMIDVSLEIFKSLH